MRERSPSRIWNVPSNEGYHADVQQGDTLRLETGVYLSNFECWWIFSNMAHEDTITRRIRDKLAPAARAYVLNRYPHRVGDEVTP
jgi:hypothetical protein